MIIQLKNQAEKNAILVGLRVLELVLKYGDEPITFPVSEFNKFLAYGVEDPIEVGEIQGFAHRLTSDVIICNECEAEFVSPFNSIICPDCSKNQESKSA